LKSTNYIVFFLLGATVTYNANSEIAKPISIFNYPVEAIYLINNRNSQNGISWGHSYQEACKMMGEDFFWGIVPSKSASPACYTLPSFNMIIGTEFLATGAKQCI